MAIALNSGSVQFLLMKLQAEGASTFVMLSAALMISLRLAVYSVELRDHFHGVRRIAVAMVGYALIDAAFFVLKERSIELLEHRAVDVGWFLIGASSVMLVVWTGGTLVGRSLANTVDTHLLDILDFPALAIFVTLLVGSIKKTSHLATALASGTAAVLLYGTYAGLILSALAGVLAGVIFDRVHRRTSGTDGDTNEA